MSPVIVIDVDLAFDGEDGLNKAVDSIYDCVVLDIMLPKRFFRYREDGTLAEGTLCGNEINSQDVFVREYIIEMVSRYIELFDIDGIRMDLMGISDIDTV